MNLIHFTASKVWRGHEQMIIDICESLRDNNFAESQLIVCPNDSEIFKKAKERNLQVLGFDFKSGIDFQFAKKTQTTS